MKRPPFTLLLAAGVLLTAASYLAFKPSDALWALSLGTDLPLSLRAIWIGAGTILIFLYPLFPPAEKRRDERKSRPLPPLAALSLRAAAAPLLFMLFYLFRSRNLYLGDGYLLTTILENDAAPLPIRPGWGTLMLHRIVFRLLRAGGIASPGVTSFAVVSSLAGVAYVFLVFRGAAIHRRVFPDLRGRVVTALMAIPLLATAEVQLFFGYVENYTIVHLLLLAFLVEGSRALLEERARPLPFILFLLAAAFHWGAVIAFPAVVYLAVTLDLVPASLRRLPIVALLVLFLFVVPPTVSQLSIHGMFVPWVGAGTNAPYGFFSASHLLFVLNLVLLLAPLPAVVLFVRRASAGDRNDRTAGRIEHFAGIAALSFVAFAFVMRPYLGPRDWDLFSFFAPCAALWASVVLLRTVDAKRLAATAALAAGLGAFLLFPWIEGNADRSRAAERTARLSLPDPHHWIGADPKIAGLASLMWERGDRKTAYNLFEQAAGRRGDSRIIQANLGMLYWKGGRYEDAQGHLEKAIELDPDLAPPLYYLATTYFHLRKGDLGEKLFRRFLEESPGNPSAASYLGRILMWKKEWAEAERWLKAARAVLPADGDLNFWLATTCAAEGKRGEAVAFVKRSLEANPTRKDARKLLERLEGTPAGHSSP